MSIYVQWLYQDPFLAQKLLGVKLTMEELWNNFTAHYRLIKRALAFKWPTTIESNNPNLLKKALQVEHKTKPIKKCFIRFLGNAIFNDILWLACEKSVLVT